MEQPVANLKPSDFASAIAWLHEQDVPAGRLADPFHTTANNIRVIHHRESRRVQRQHRLLQLFANCVTTWDWDAICRLRGVVGVRKEHDTVDKTERREAKLDWLESEVRSRTQRAMSDHQFSKGIRELKEMMPYFGHSSDVRRIGLLAQVHHNLAWFYVYSGMCRSAMHDAVRSMALSKICFDESQGKGLSELSRLAQAALVASNACLLQQDAKSASLFLAVAKEAIGAAKDNSLKVVYCHQMGTFHFQLHQDEQASKYFERAVTAQKKYSQDCTETQLLITGARKTNLIELRWDESGGAEELLKLVSQDYSEGTVQRSMAVNWAAACGMLVDSADANQRALKYLAASNSTAQRFGHQATVSTLLSMTCDLKLSPSIRSNWIRHALYENAFSHK